MLHAACNTDNFYQHNDEITAALRADVGYRRVGESSRSQTAFAAKFKQSFNALLTSVDFSHNVAKSLAI